MANEMSILYYRQPKPRNPRNSDCLTCIYNAGSNDYKNINKSVNFCFANTRPVETLYLANCFHKRRDCPGVTQTKINPREKKVTFARRRQYYPPPPTHRMNKSQEGLSPITTHEYLKIMAKKCSVPDTRQTDEHEKHIKKRRRSEIHLNTSAPYRTRFAVNAAILDPDIIPSKCLPLLKNPLMQAQLRIYRCQLSTAEESCCCSCNSDAMFEVMKSLYDCYKKKDCNHCDCILCGHLAREERKLGEARKSAVAAAVETASVKERKKDMMKKAKEAGLLEPLTGKTPEEKEKMVRGLGMMGLPLPAGKTDSEKKIIDKVRKDIGLPPEPKTAEQKEKYHKAEQLGLIQPLEGKTKPEKENILRQLHDLGIELPEGRTASEKSMIAKIQASDKKPRVTPSEKMRKAKAAGFLTPLEGKTPEQKEKILRGLAQSGIPLPEGKTASEKKLIDKVRKDLGLPPEPKSTADKEKYALAQSAGLITPLEGKTPAQKEKILRGLAERGVPLPEGRTASEKALINNIKATAKPIPSEKLRKAKAAGFLTPLEGKTPEQKEKIVRGLAQSGLPLPEGKTASEKKIIDKVRKDLGLPPEPTTPEDKEKYAHAQAAGLITPLEGKTPAQKEKILRGLAEKGVPLPEGRTASEKALINNIKATAKPIPSEKLRKAKAAGFLTPLEGKTPEQKEKIVRGLAQSGLPLPEGKTASEKKIIDKVRKDLGLPPEPATPADKEKYAHAQTAGLITPLEGKTPAQKEKILKGLAERGVPLPEGRTASEKALIDNIKATVKPIPSEKLRKAKAAGLLTPLEGKTPEQKEKIVRGLAQSGLPLPEGKTASEKKIIDKVRKDLGLPPEPATPADKEKYAHAQTAGIITPLEGKTPAQKEKILKGLAERGIPLPEGRTASEKALIDNIKATVKPIASEKIRKAKEAGHLTSLTGKTPEQKEKILRGLAEHGIPLPEGKTASEKKLIDKVRQDLGLPPEPKTAADKEKYHAAQQAGLITPLQGKSPAQKEKILKGLAERGIPLPEGRTASEKALIDNIKATIKPIPSEKLRKAKVAGLLTPLEGKTPEQKEKIIRGLAQSGLPLPEGKTASEKKIIDKVRKDLGLPPEPATPADKEKYAHAQTAGLITPLEGKTPAQKEKILKGLAERGIPLPEGRTASEKALIDNIKATVKPIASEKIRKAKEAGHLTSLTGKTPEQKEKILRGLAEHGIPLPEGKTASEKKLIDKVRQDLGLPPEPKTTADKEKYHAAQQAGLVTPLQGKSPAQKEKILKGLAERGIPLPEGRTASEKALIDNIKATVKPIPSEKLRKAKAAGFLTPLEGKTPEQKEKIVRGLAQSGLPLPEGKTASEKKIIDKVRKDLGLPPEPATPADKEKYAHAQTAGLITPLEGKTPAQKEKILKGLAERGVPLPEGRTASEKALIDNIKATVKPIPSEKLRRAKAAGLLTPLAGKTPEQKDKILRGLAEHGIPLPSAHTPSDQKIVDKVRKDLGLPPEPKTLADKEKYAKAQAAGLITPLEGKSPDQKEKILRGLAEKGITLPEGRTSSEKALIDKVKAEVKPIPSALSEKMRKAKAAGLLTPLAGKTPEQKEKILRGLAQHGVPLPQGDTPSDKKLIDKIRKELGLPPEVAPGRVASEKLRAAKAAGLLTPLQGKTPEQKEKIFRDLAKLGLPLPEAKTKSEKQLIDRIRSEIGLPPEPSTKSKKEKYELARTQGLITPLEGKTPAQKEKILRGRAAAGLPLPKGKTPSEKSLIKKIKAETGYVTPTKKTKSERLRRAKEAGLLTPLEGKTPEQKEKILKGLAKAGLPLPEGKTQSEKKLINKVRNELGLPPTPETPSLKEKMSRARSAGILTPLEGKTPEQKENILRKLAEAGIPLPEGRTPSEKALIKKIAADVQKIPSAKLKEAKAAGLLTPLDGKTKEQKEKILKGLAEAGLPLPEGKTASEKSMIKKIQDKQKAKAAGLLTPLAGKTKAEKEKILKGLAEAGLPMPEGDTASEKEMIRKARAAAGRPPEVSPSEGKRYKSMKTGASKVKGMVARSVAGIKEDIEEIVKTTTCERGCGCDKKKIRFKHSYIKIRVTSPDISSFCPCPDECFPRVKTGVVTDNEGIKVTVGSVSGVPSYRMYPETEATRKILLENIGQPLKASDSCISSASHISLEIESMSDPDISSDSSGSTSTVYIYNSDSNVSIADIKHLLRLAKHNGDYKKNIEKCRQKDKDVSYIYCSHLDASDTALKRKSLLKQKQCFVTDYAKSVSNSYNTVATDSSLSLNSDSECAIDALSVLSLLAKKLRYSTSSFCLHQSQSRGSRTERTKFSANENIVMPVQICLENDKIVHATVKSNQRLSTNNRVATNGLYKTEMTMGYFNTVSQKPKLDRAQKILNKLRNMMSWKRNTRSSSMCVVSASECDESSTESLNSSIEPCDTRSTMVTSQARTAPIRYRSPRQLFSSDVASTACQTTKRNMITKPLTSKIRLKLRRRVDDAYSECTPSRESDDFTLESQCNSDVVSELINRMIACELSEGFNREGHLNLQYKLTPSSTYYPSDTVENAPKSDISTGPSRYGTKSAESSEWDKTSSSLRCGIYSTNSDSYREKEDYYSEEHRCGTNCETTEYSNESEGPSLDSICQSHDVDAMDRLSTLMCSANREILDLYSQDQNQKEPSVENSEPSKASQNACRSKDNTDFPKPIAVSHSVAIQMGHKCTEEYFGSSSAIEKSCAIDGICGKDLKNPTKYYTRTVASDESVEQYRHPTFHKCNLDDRVNTIEPKKAENSVKDFKPNSKEHTNTTENQKSSLEQNISEIFTKQGQNFTAKCCSSNEPILRAGENRFKVSKDPNDLHKEDFTESSRGCVGINVGTKNSHPERIVMQERSSQDNTCKNNNQQNAVKLETEDCYSPLRAEKTIFDINYSKGLDKCGKTWKDYKGPKCPANNCYPNNNEDILEDKFVTKGNETITTHGKYDTLERKVSSPEGCQGPLCKMRRCFAGDAKKNTHSSSDKAQSVSSRSGQKLRKTEQCFPRGNDAFGAKNRTTHSKRDHVPLSYADKETMKKYCECSHDEYTGTANKSRIKASDSKQATPARKCNDKKKVDVTTETSKNCDCDTNKPSIAAKKSQINSSDSDSPNYVNREGNIRKEVDCDRIANTLKKSRTKLKNIKNTIRKSKLKTFGTLPRERTEKVKSHVPARLSNTVKKSTIKSRLPKIQFHEKKCECYSDEVQGDVKESLSKSKDTPAKILIVEKKTDKKDCERDLNKKSGQFHSDGVSGGVKESHAKSKVTSTKNYVDEKKMRKKNYERDLKRKKFSCCSNEASDCLKEFQVKSSVTSIKSNTEVELKICDGKVLSGKVYIRCPTYTSTGQKSSSERNSEESLNCECSPRERTSTSFPEVPVVKKPNKPKTKYSSEPSETKLTKTKTRYPSKPTVTKTKYSTKPTATKTKNSLKGGITLRSAGSMSTTSFKEICMDQAKGRGELSSLCKEERVTNVTDLTKNDSACTCDLEALKKELIQIISPPVPILPSTSAPTSCCSKAPPPSCKITPPCVSTAPHSTGILRKFPLEIPSPYPKQISSKICCDVSPQCPCSTYFPSGKPATDSSCCICLLHKPPCGEQSASCACPPQKPSSDKQSTCCSCLPEKSPCDIQPPCSTCPHQKPPCDTQSPSCAGLSQKPPCDIQSPCFAYILQNPPSDKSPYSVCLPKMSPCGKQSLCSACLPEKPPCEMQSPCSACLPQKPPCDMPSPCSACLQQKPPCVSQLPCSACLPQKPPCDRHLPRSACPPQKPPRVKQLPYSPCPPQKPPYDRKSPCSACPPPKPPCVKQSPCSVCLPQKPPCDRHPPRPACPSQKPPCEKQSPCSACPPQKPPCDKQSSCCTCLLQKPPCGKQSSCCICLPQKPPCDRQSPCSTCPPQKPPCEPIPSNTTCVCPKSPLSNFSTNNYQKSTSARPSTSSSYSGFHRKTSYKQFSTSFSTSEVKSRSACVSQKPPCVPVPPCCPNICSKSPCNATPRPASAPRKPPFKPSSSYSIPKKCLCEKPQPFSGRSRRAKQNSKRLTMRRNTCKALNCDGKPRKRTNEECPCRNDDEKFLNTTSYEHQKSSPTGRSVGVQDERYSRYFNGAGNPMSGPYTQTPVPYNQLPGPYGQTPVPYNQMPGPYGQMPGPYNQIPSPYGQTLNPDNQMPDPYSQSLSPTNQMPGPYSQLSDPYNQMAGPYNQMPGPYNQIPGPYNPTPSPYSQMSDPYQQNSGPYNQPLDPYNQAPDPYNQLQDPLNGQPDPYNQTSNNQFEEQMAGNPQNPQRLSIVGPNGETIPYHGQIPEQGNIGNPNRMMQPTTGQVMLGIYNQIPAISQEQNVGDTKNGYDVNVWKSVVECVSGMNGGVGGTNGVPGDANEAPLGQMSGGHLVGVAVRGGAQKRIANGLPGQLGSNGVGSSEPQRANDNGGTKNRIQRQSAIPRGRIISAQGQLPNPQGQAMSLPRQSIVSRRLTTGPQAQIINRPPGLVVGPHGQIAQPQMIRPQSQMLGFQGQNIRPQGQLIRPPAKYPNQLTLQDRVDVQVGTEPNMINREARCCLEKCSSWLDAQELYQKDLRRMRSIMARTTSGFKFQQNRKPSHYAYSDQSSGGPEEKEPDVTTVRCSSLYKSNHKLNNKSNHKCECSEYFDIRHKMVNHECECYSQPVLKKSKKKKNHTCECFVELTPSSMPYSLYTPYIDSPPAPPYEYDHQYPIAIRHQTVRRWRSQPESLDVMIPDDTAPPKGLKLHVGGKGSANKALAGIFCFNLASFEYVQCAGYDSSILSVSSY